MNETQIRREMIQTMIRFGKIHFLFREGQVTKGEYFVLTTLHTHHVQCPDAKGMYVSALAELLRVTPPAVSRMLRSMEYKSYIERVVDREDRRTTYIILTPHGECVRLESERRADCYASRVIARMGEEEMTHLLSEWNRLMDIMQEEQPKED